MQEKAEVKPMNSERSKSKLLKRVLLILLVVLLMAASAGGAYWWRGRTATTFEHTQAASIARLQKDKSRLQRQLAVLKATNTATTASPHPVSAVCTPKAPDAATIQNIEASITSGNTAALEGYMAASVQDVYAAADVIPAKTPAASVSDITTFVSDPSTGTWTFPVSAASLTTYRADSYGQYFPSIAVVGGSTGHRVISFSFDCNGKIDTIFMAADDSVL